MSSANVQLDTIRGVRVALIKFAETAGLALADADADILRTLSWLEMEMAPYWATQIRKREELVGRCKEAVRQKLLYNDPTGRPQSAVDEQKALKQAQLSLGLAQEKFTAAKQYVRRIQKQHMEYRGQAQRLAMRVAGDLKDQAAHLQALYNTIAEYARSDAATEARSVAQAVDERRPDTPPADASSTPEQRP